MFEKIRALFDDLFSDEETALFAEDDYRVAAAALLVHLGHSDGGLDEPEKQYLQRVAEESFGLDAKAAHALIVQAEAEERRSVDLYRFTSVLKRSLDEEGRKTVIELLWRMAYADGQEHEFEDNMIWRVAELLGVSSEDRIAMRRRVRDGLA